MQYHQTNTFCQPSEENVDLLLSLLSHMFIHFWILF